MRSLVLQIAIGLTILIVIGALAYREQLIRAYPVDVRKYQAIVQNILTEEYRTTFLTKYPELDYVGYEDIDDEEIYAQTPYSLLRWLGKRLTYTESSITRHDDPIEILEYGKGRCKEFALAFLAIMYAQRYTPRLILDRSPLTDGNGDHVWIEYHIFSDHWIHVDPTEGATYTTTHELWSVNPFINNPFMYERDWEKELSEVWAIEPDWCRRVEEKYQYEEI